CCSADVCSSDLVLHFTWPNRVTLDDRGNTHSGNAPSNITPNLVTSMPGILAAWNDPFAPVFQHYAHDLRSSGLVGLAVPWQELLWGNDRAAEQAYDPLALSYLALGFNMVAARSSLAAAV